VVDADDGERLPLDRDLLADRVALAEQRAASVSLTITTRAAAAFSCGVKLRPGEMSPASVSSHVSLSAS
jgi:hypothetical protein